MGYGRGAMAVSAVLLLAVLGACASSDGEGDGEEAPAVSSAVSHVAPDPEAVWGWERLTGSDPLDVTDRERYTLTLGKDDRYVVRADCNRGSGAYTLNGDRLELKPGAMSLAACPPESLADRYTQLLGQVRGIGLEGDRLTLELDSGATMEFGELKPVELAGTSWLVRSYNNGKQAVVTVQQGTRLELAFTEDGTVGGSAGCNNFTGSVTLEGDSAAFGPLAATRKMCPGEGVMEQEAAFLNALSTVARRNGVGSRLQLRTAETALAVDLVSVVTGTVTTRVRRALPPDARVEVVLLDVSLADVPAVTLASQRFVTGGRQVPFPFELAFDPGRIVGGHSYAVRATISDPDGKLMFTSTRVHGVLTRDHPRYDVEVEVDPVP